MIILFGIAFCTFLFSVEGLADDPTNSNDQRGFTRSSEDEDDTIESSYSKNEINGTIAFDPQQYDNMNDKRIGQNQSVIVPQ